MWPFSYSRCAVDIVYLAEKPSLRDASCCSVVVRNGAYGDRRYGLRSTLDNGERRAVQAPGQRAGAVAVQDERDAVAAGWLASGTRTQGAVRGEVPPLRDPAAVQRRQPCGEGRRLVAGLRICRDLLPVRRSGQPLPGPW